MPLPPLAVPAFFDRQEKIKYRPLAVDGPHTDLPPVQVNDLFGDGKTQAGSAGLSFVSRKELAERLK
jgi:hypothetical protein